MNNGKEFRFRVVAFVPGTKKANHRWWFYDHYPEDESQRDFWPVQEGPLRKYTNLPAMPRTPKGRKKRPAGGQERNQERVCREEVMHGNSL